MFLDETAKNWVDFLGEDRICLENIEELKTVLNTNHDDT